MVGEESGNEEGRSLGEEEEERDIYTEFVLGIAR